MPRLLVAVSFSIDPDILTKINETVNGKSQSEKIRRVLELGFEVFMLQQKSAEKVKNSRPS